jgi:hypothetical protein
MPHHRRDSGRPRTPLIFVHQVEGSLIARVGMSRRHQGAFDAEVCLQDFADRRETVRRAGRIGHDVMLGWITGYFIDS